MEIKKLEHILNNGSFNSDISPEVRLALKAKLNKNSVKNLKKTTTKPLLDFDKINQEAIKLANSEVKYPQKLPKGVIISVRKKPLLEILE